MQQINLLKELNKPQRPLLPGRLIVQISLMFIALLTFISAYTHLDTWLEQRQLQATQQIKQQADAAMQVVALKNLHVLNEEALQERIDGLREELMNKKAALNVFTQARQLGGFATYLQALAEHIPAGVWLQRIAIDANQRDITLEGKSLEPLQIPDFMDALADSEYFEHSTFQIFSIEREPGRAYLQFNLGSLNLEVRPLSEKNRSASASLSSADEDAKLNASQQPLIPQINTYQQTQQDAIDTASGSSTKNIDGVKEQ